MAADRWLSKFLGILTLLPTSVQAHYCSSVFINDRVEVSHLLDERGVVYSGSWDLLVIEPMADGHNLNQLARFVEKNLGQRMVMLAHLSANVMEEDCVIYLPSIFIRMADLLSVFQLEQLIYTDAMSKRVKHHG